MKKFFPIYDIKAIDKRTTELQGIEYIQLIDRAARALCDWVTDNYTRRKVVVLAGPGNNGADGIGLAILLREREWMVDVHTYTGYKGRRGENNEAYLSQLSDTDVEYDENEPRPELTAGCLVVDALFGTGLKRDLEGPAAEVCRYINASHCEVVSIDIPSGLGNEDSYLEATGREIMRAAHTVTFQFPKMAFFLPELAKYIGRWHVLDIRLDVRAIEEAPTFMYYSDNAETAALVRHRDRFAHKGTMGHALLFAGSEGMSGAAILATRATLRSGVGLVTTATAGRCYVPLQSAVPEAMAIVGHGGREDIVEWDGRMDLERVTAVGIGPGLGRDVATRELVRRVIKTYGGRVPLVIDADGLYALRSLLDEGMELPTGVVMTPHPGELDRLTEPHREMVERIDAACLLAIRHQAVVVLKGAFTMTALPDGRRVFNTTGNSGMATAGSGDVLTGVILGLLAQGYRPEHAALLGVSLHAAAGDCAARELTEEAMTSGDIVGHIGAAYRELRKGGKRVE